MTPFEEAEAAMRFSSQLNVDDWNKKILEKSANGGKLPLAAITNETAAKDEGRREQQHGHQEEEEKKESSSISITDEPVSSSLSSSKDEARSGRWG